MCVCVCLPCSVFLAVTLVGFVGDRRGAQIHISTAVWSERMRIMRNEKRNNKKGEPSGGGRGGARGRGSREQQQQQRKDQSVCVW